MPTARPPAPPVRFSAARAAVVLVTLLVGFVVLLGRVTYLQTYGRRETLSKAQRQQFVTQVLRARRGCIYDRNGIEMAGTIQQQMLFADPKFMQDVFSQDGKSLVEMDRAVTDLATLVDRDPFELSQLLSDKFQSRYVKIAEQVDERTAEQIDKLDLPGTGLQPVNVRYYPMGAIAAHVLGGTGRDGQGLEGLEKKFENLLAGRDGFKRTMKDARHRPISVAAEDYLPAQHGQHLMLTLDANIQMIAEQELRAACEEFGAKNGEVVVLDPRTGEVLALANWPTFNPQMLGESPAEVRLNRALAAPYEPGSTLKPFIVGPAIAARVTRVGEVWGMPTSSYQSELRRKPITDVHHYAQLCTWDVLVKSSNIAMTMLGERMGKQRLHGAIAGFGFGRPTGIELPAEDPGLLPAAPKIGNSDVVSMVQGYHMMVTPMQLARAFCAFANGGRLVQPSIVKGVLDSDGRVVARVQSPGVELMPAAIDPITAGEMKRVLCDTVVRGTAKKARSRTWNIFGKTGTSHKATAGPNGGRVSYNNSGYNSSFVAGAPAEEPRIVVAFVIHEPDRKKAHFGGDVAAPGAGRLIDRVLTYLQVDASPDLDPPPPQIAAKLYNFNPKDYRWPDAPGAAGSVVTAADTAEAVDVGD